MLSPPARQGSGTPRPHEFAVLFQLARAQEKVKGMATNSGDGKFWRTGQA
nr:hypothetical protein GCM10020241_13940 [Streptoalloteichus tenebrarius]